MFAFLSALLLAISVKESGTPLKSGNCSEDSETVATLNAGAPVEVRFALSGESVACYKVFATVDGKQVDGYLPGSALDGIEDFDKQRRDAAFNENITVTKAAKAVEQSTLRASTGDPRAQTAVKLIEANQPGRALDLLEGALRANGRDPGLLTLAGLAAWRADETRRALDYWRTALDIKPDADLERLYNRVKKESQGDKSGEKVYGLHFLLRYEGEIVPADLARSMVAVLDQEFNRIATEVGCPSDERIVAIVQSREAYRRTLDAAEWSAGQYDGRIRIALMEGARIGPDTRRAFAHEIVHACLSNTGSWPSWFHEGLAQKLSGDRLSPTAQSRLTELIKAHALPKLENLGQDWSRMNSLNAAVAYNLALAAVDVFFADFSQYGIRNLVNNPERLAQITTEIDRKLGL